MSISFGLDFVCYFRLGFDLAVSRRFTSSRYLIFLFLSEFSTY